MSIEPERIIRFSDFIKFDYDSLFFAYGNESVPVLISDFNKELKQNIQFESPEDYVFLDLNENKIVFLQKNKIINTITYDTYERSYRLRTNFKLVSKNDAEFFITSNNPENPFIGEITLHIVQTN